MRGYDRVNKVLEITRVSDILPLHESLEEALAALPTVDSAGRE